MVDSVGTGKTYIPYQTVQYLIKQQKYLETLQTRDTKAALLILRQELMPLSTNQDRLHELAR